MPEQVNEPCLSDEEMKELDEFWDSYGDEESEDESDDGKTEEAD